MADKQLSMLIKSYQRPAPVDLGDGVFFMPEATMVHVGVGDIVIADGSLGVIVGLTDVGKVNDAGQYGLITTVATVADAATGHVRQKVFFGNKLRAVDISQIIENKFDVCAT